MAGFYFLRGTDEEIFRLPGWSKDDLVQEVTPAGKTADALHPAPYLPEIEIAIQDRMFDTKGQLYYPSEATNPDIHPFWSPEFFGDIITVNGKTWPYLSVAPRKYRFHFLDGSNARFYRMWLQNAETGAPGPEFIQIGTDGGLLDVPVVINPAAGKKLLMGPGERADLIIDFSKVPQGTVLTLMNDANAPFPDGDEVEENTTDRIMQFIVNGKMVNRVYPKLTGTDKSLVPGKLRLIPLVKLTDFRGRENIKPDVIRQLTLNEVMDEGGPEKVLLNNTTYEMIHGEGMHEMNMPGIVTEKPVEGTVEKWQLINLTMDAHPMHMHLVQFQLVGRQNFDMERYMDDYMKSFTGQNGGMAGMYMGAEGPPFDYNTKNSDGALGGNLPITDYLLGSMIPAEPNERGWKDVILAYPNQIMTYMVRFAPTQLPLWWPKRLSLYGFDPSKGPGYVWHCHIVEHEDNDMMRPMDVQPNPVRVNKPLDGKSTQPNILLSDKVFSLGQNYPNPFSNETEFSFTIPTDCHVTLTVLNYKGALIKTIIDSDVPAGLQYVRLTTDGLPKGTYFYRIQAGTFAATKTMIIN
jgi:FtsP/CotA-like multicopper oxidase with cupredoxin domain